MTTQRREQQDPTAAHHELVQRERAVMKLTSAQQRYLKVIQAAGTKRYNGRAERTLKVLKNAGLIELEYEIGIGSRYSTDVWIARAKVNNDVE